MSAKRATIGPLRGNAAKIANPRQHLIPTAKSPFFSPVLIDFPASAVFLP